MKLLNGQVETVTDGDISVSVSVISTAKQARLMDLALIKGAEGRICFVNYLLRECIDSISISGEDFDPVELSEKADISDQETLKALLKIGEIAEGVVFPAPDTEKK